MGCFVMYKINFSKDGRLTSIQMERDESREFSLNESVSCDDFETVFVQPIGEKGRFVHLREDDINFWICIFPSLFTSKKYVEKRYEDQELDHSELTLDQLNENFAQHGAKNITISKFDEHLVLFLKGVVQREVDLVYREIDKIITNK